MRKLFLTVLSLTLLFAACKKDQKTEDQNVGTSLASNISLLKDEGMDVMGKPVIDAIYDGFPVKVVKLDEDTYLLDGDMMLSARELGLAKGPMTESTTVNNIWPQKKVYYKFDANATQTLKNYWAQAIQFYTALGFEFIQGAGTDGAYINVQYITQTASSAVGKQGGAQNLKFDPAGWTVGSLAHEIGHALGLHHEQCRPDRDLYLDVHTTSHNYQIATSWGVGPMDYGSIMIYGSSGSSDANMSKLDGSGWSIQRTALSNTDKLGLNYMYDADGYLAGGTYEIKNSLSGKNLDVSASNGNISVWGDNSGNNQRWQLTHVSGGYYKIISIANPTKALDVSNSGTSAGSDVGIYNYNGTDNQLWQIVPGPTTGTYQLFAKHARTKPLDVQNAGTGNGTNVLLGSYSLGGRTYWTMEKVN